MKARRLILSAALMALAAAPAFAQEPSGVPEHQDASPAPQVVERARARDTDGGAVRAPRSPERVGLPEGGPRVRADGPAPAPAPAAPAFEEQGGRRRPGGGSSGRGSGGSSGGRVSGGGGSRGEGSAVRRGGVRNPDNDPRGGQVARAVPRSQAPRPPNATWGQSYGRRYYAGTGGLGYYFYDPWSWYGWGWPAYSAYGGWGAWGGYYGNNWGGYYGNAWGGGWDGGWGTGGVRIKVNARDAEVYVDGYYAGIVDDFDGVWQQLRLDDGGYRVEVKKPGFETLSFDVMVQPGRTITYRGRMEPTP